MILNEEQLSIRKEYKTYLSSAEGKKGQMLGYILSATDEYVQPILRKWYNIEIPCLYDNSLSIEDLVKYSMYINTNEEILASNHGYISGQAIELYCRFIADKEGYDLVIIKESLARLNSNSNFSEGDEKEIQGIVYERDPKARKACIEYYGCKCIICGMDFEQVYGDLGKGFIEVHHIIPISERGGHYIVDPIKDLRPLCSNCHSMIHRLKHVLTIEELKKIIVSPTDNKHL